MKQLRYHTGALQRLVVYWLVFSVVALAQSTLQRAVELARKGQYVQARKLLEGIPEPGDLRQRIAFHRLKAAIASGLHEPQQAVHEIRAALALAPGDPDLLLATAAAELQAGQLESALSHAQASTESAAKEALIGDIQERRGEAVQAAKAYELAVTLEPREERYRLALGLELIEHERAAEAIELLQRSAAEFPQSSKIRTLLGIAQYAEGYTDDAIRSLEEAIRIDPKLNVPYAALSKIVLQSSAAPSEAIIDDLCRWDRLVCSALELRLARENGNRELQAKAMADLERAPSSNLVSRCELARAYEWSGQLAKARVAMESCVHLDPSPQNLYRLGLIYQRLGLTDLAKKQMEQRKEILRRMSEQTALSLNALEGFKLSIY